MDHGVSGSTVFSLEDLPRESFDALRPRGAVVVYVNGKPADLRIEMLGPLTIGNDVGTDALDDCRHFLESLADVVRMALDKPSAVTPAQ